MSIFKISLHDFKSIESFTDLVSEFDFNIYLKPAGDTYGTKINAKSILGVISLLHFMTLEMMAETDQPEELQKKLQPFIAQA